MHKRLATLALFVLVLIPLIALASSSAPGPSTNATCNVWIGTDYFSDAAMTNRVGLCTVSCFDATHGNATPTFTGGGTCSGTSGPYTLRRNFACPGICP